jgi:hypothetical protein
VDADETGDALGVPLTLRRAALITSVDARACDGARWENIFPLRHTCWRRSLLSAARTTPLASYINFQELLIS